MGLYRAAAERAASGDDGDTSRFSQATMSVRRAPTELSPSWSSGKSVPAFRFRQHVS